MNDELSKGSWRSVMNKQRNKIKTILTQENYQFSIFNFQLR